MITIWTWWVVDGCVSPFVCNENNHDICHVPSIVLLTRLNSCRDHLVYVYIFIRTKMSLYLKIPTALVWLKNMHADDEPLSEVSLHTWMWQHPFSVLIHVTFSVQINYVSAILNIAIINKAWSDGGDKHIKGRKWTWGSAVMINRLSSAIISGSTLA